MGFLKDMTNYLTVNTAFSLSMFCCFCSIEGCTYRFRVVLILECPKISLKPEHDLSKLLYNMVLIHPSTFVKKKAYEECGLFDVTYKYCMDKELLYRMYKAGKKFDYIDQCLTKFKAGGVSDTHSKAVFKEGSRMALSYGEPQIKVKSIEIIKTVRNQMVNMIKGTRVYRVLKGI